MENDSQAQEFNDPMEWYRKIKTHITGLKLKFLKFCKVEKMIFFIKKIIFKQKKIVFFDNKNLLLKKDNFWTNN